MVVFGTLRCFRGRSRSIRGTSSLFSALTVPPLSSSPPLQFLSRHLRLLFPFCPWRIPFGSLFPSYPSRKLCKSGTPVQCDIVLLRNLKTLRSKSSPPIGLNPSSPSRILWLLNWSNATENTPDVLPSDPLPPDTSAFFNFPNLISMTRLLSGPLIGWMITNGWYTSSFIGLVISGGTDWLDGYVARRMRIDSVVGSYLDPLADKVLIGSVALAMVSTNLLEGWLVGIIVVRDVILISGAAYKRGRSMRWKWRSWYDYFNLNQPNPDVNSKIRPLFISKINTVFQLAFIGTSLLQPQFGTEETQSYITHMSWLVASTTMASTVAYFKQHFRH